MRLQSYATRDTAPEKWCSRAADGQSGRFDDLPVPYRANINRDVPFKPKANASSRLTATEIDDVVAFLKTLTDGYNVEKSAARASSCTRRPRCAHTTPI
jgi:cytochrome c peroxidase